MTNYIIKYDATKFGTSSNNDVPCDLTKAILGVSLNAELYSHCASRSFLKAKLPEGCASAIRGLEGIVFVAIDKPNIRLEKQWKRPFSPKQHPY